MAKKAAPKARKAKQKPAASKRKAAKAKPTPKAAKSKAVKARPKKAAAAPARKVAPKPASKSAKSAPRPEPKRAAATQSPKAAKSKPATDSRAKGSTKAGAKPAAPAAPARPPGPPRLAQRSSHETRPAPLRTPARGKAGRPILPGGQAARGGDRDSDGPEHQARPPEGRVPRTKLTPKQLREFQELLLRKRAQLTGDMENMTDQALNRNGAGSGDSTVPVHMADLGSDNWEQELTLGLIESEKTLLREIDAALGRIRDRTYGVCLGTHKPIELPRLRAKPWAKYCIEYARLREQGRAP